MSNPNEDENKRATHQTLTRTNKKQKLMIDALEKKVVYLQEKILAQEVMLKDALTYTNELEIKIKFFEKGL